MSYFKGLAAYILLAVVLVAGSAYAGYNTRAFSDEMRASMPTPVVTQPQASVPAPTGRVETFGKNSPIVTANSDVTITYGKGEAPKDGPKVLEHTYGTAVTHGDDSPVVIGSGASITINYK